MLFLVAFAKGGAIEDAPEAGNECFDDLSDVYSVFAFLVISKSRYLILFS